MVRIVFFIEFSGTMIKHPVVGVRPPGAIYSFDVNSAHG
jgi:hypothetical protein